MEESKRGKIGSTIFFAVISFLFAVVLVALMLKFMGMPVGQTFLSLGNKIPVMNELLPETNSIHVQAEEEDNSDYWKAEYEKLEVELQEKNQKIKELNEQLGTNQKEMQELERDLDELKSQFETKQSETVKEQMKQVAGIYATMSASKAAKLFEAMPLEEAAVTFMYLDQTQQSDILGSMKDTEKAAAMTMMLKDIALLPETNQGSLENKIRELVLAKQNPVSAMSETINKMPAAQSATIIQTMMGTNEKVAMEIMKAVSSDIRSQILTQLAQQDANLAAKITADLNK